MARRGAREGDQFAAPRLAERLASYEYERPRDPSAAQIADPELVERAATLLLVMPPNQPRETIEELISPHDRERGRRAVAVLIDSAFAAEDSAGRLHRSG
jgi:hypothetical protein